MQKIFEQLDSVMPAEMRGHVVSTQGMTISVAGMPAPVGAVVEIDRQTGSPVRGEIVGFKDKLSIVYPFSTTAGIRHGNRVRLTSTTRYLRMGENLLGRVVDGFGETIDNLPTPALPDRGRLDNMPPDAFERPRIDRPLSTGIRVIDGMLSCGMGQRIGIFSGSGVGKSVMLGMMARYTSADVNVIALIGERGREVNEFIERDLGPAGASRSVVVVATSDQPAIQRVQAAMTATTIAEYFRDRGSNVLLMMDSLTRFAMAQREIGLAAGEPPTTRGYPPSVFALLPKLVERTGRSADGSITAFYSVLVEGDDVNEPISDTVRGILDGHVILSRKIASQGHYPAVDVLASISRLATELTTEEQKKAMQILRQNLAVYRENEDLITIGAYRTGANPQVDTAIAMRDDINKFLQQSMGDRSSFEKAQAELAVLAEKSRALQHARPNPNPPQPQVAEAGE